MLFILIDETLFILIDETLFILIDEMLFILIDKMLESQEAQLQAYLYTDKESK